MDTSLAYAEQAMALRPASADARALLARNYLATGDVARATPIIRELQKAAPELAAVQNLAAALHLAGKRPDAARASYEKARRLDPQDLEAVTGLVQLDFRSGRPGDATARVESLLTQGRRDGPALVLAAQTHARARDGKRAEDLLLEAIGKNPGRLANYALLGELYSQDQRLDDAVRQFEQMLQRDPRSLTASTMLGIIHERRGDTGAAEKAYQQALSIEGRAVIAANNLAWLYVSSNRNLDRALDLAQIAHQQIPDDAQIKDTLGWIYVRKNLPATGIPLLEASAQRQPENAEVHYHLGIAYAQTDDADKARPRLTKAIALGLNAENEAAARAALLKTKG